MYDYQKSITSQTKNIATLQKQLAALQGDDSEEGRAKRTKLQLSLDEANQELQDTEYERYLSDQQNMLDNLYTEYEDLMNSLFKDQNKLLQDGIHYINSNSSEIKAVLDDYADTYGYVYSDNFKEVVKEFNTTSGNVVTSMRNALNDEDSGSIAKVLVTQADKIAAAYSGSKDTSASPASNSNNTNALNQQEDAKNKAGSSITGTASKLGNNGNNSVATAPVYSTLTTGGTDANLAYGVNQFIRLNGKKPAKNHTYKPLNAAIKKEFGVVLTTANLKKLAKKVGVTYNGSEKSDNLYKKLKSIGVQGFKHGGIGRLVKANGEDGIAMVRNGEGFISPEHVKQIQDLLTIVPDMTAFTKSLTKVPTLPAAKQRPNTFGDIHFDNIELPNVQDVDDFVTALQNDTKVQHALEISVHDLMNTGKITNDIQRVR